MTGIHFKDAADLEDYIKAEIKAARESVSKQMAEIMAVAVKTRGEEVLELVIKVMYDSGEAWKARQVYQERFGS